MSISASSVNSGICARDSVIRCAIVRCVGVSSTSSSRPPAAAQPRAAAGAADVGAHDPPARSGALDARERDAQLAGQASRDRRRPVPADSAIVVGRGQS